MLYMDTTVTGFTWQEWHILVIFCLYLRNQGIFRCPHTHSIEKFLIRRQLRLREMDAY